MYEGGGVLQSLPTALSRLFIKFKNRFLGIFQNNFSTVGNEYSWLFTYFDYRIDRHVAFLIV